MGKAFTFQHGMHIRVSITQFAPPPDIIRIQRSGEEPSWRTPTLRDLAGQGRQRFRDSGAAAGF